MRRTNTSKVYRSDIVNQKNTRVFQILTENIPGSSIKCTGKPRIERINSPPDQLEKLKKNIASNKLSPIAKQNKIRRLLGFCFVCGEIPEFFMIYDCNGVQKIDIEHLKTSKYD